MHPESDLIPRLAAAAWGTCWGVLLASATTAALIATSGDTADHRHPALLASSYLRPYEVVAWQERYEHIWYVLVCVCGAGGAWATRFVRVSPWLAAVAAVAFVPAATDFCRGVFAGKFVTGRIFTATMILAGPLLCRRLASVRLVSTARRLARTPAPSPASDAPASFGDLSPAGRGEREWATQSADQSHQSPPPLPAGERSEQTVKRSVPGEGAGHRWEGRMGDGALSSTATSTRVWLTAVILCVPLAFLLYSVFAPHDLASAASECYAEAHVGSYLVGPAQYYRAPDVVPGLDFESHYGIGHALAFSRVMGNGGLQPVLERYILFVLLVSVAYFLSAHLVLTDWLRNPWAACAVTLILAAAAAEGLAYTMPSCWPVRHPFAFAFLFCAVRGNECRNWCLAAGAVAGVSLFWQSDTGLFTLAAGVALYAANALFLGGSFRKPAAFLAAGLGTFAALCLGFFGPRVLSITFAERLLEPLLLYAGGFGTALMGWRGGWGWWYNLAGPGPAIASVGAFLSYGRRGAPREVAYGAVAALLGLAMLTKWVNRSIDILWALNGGLVLAVAGWWACVAWRCLSEKLANPTRRTFLGMALLGLLAIGVWADARLAKPDPLLRSTSPLVRIADRLDTFPNPINGLRRRIEPFEMPLPFDAQAVAYLRAHTTETERVAVLSPHDWGVLAAAGRAPRLSWLPLFLVHSPVLLDRCADDLRDSDRVFVARGAPGTLNSVNPAAHARLVPILADCFEPAGESEHWTLYRRKPGK